jgi:hypothetical protein
VIEDYGVWIEKKNEVSVGVARAQVDSFGKSEILTWHDQLHVWKFITYQLDRSVSGFVVNHNDLLTHIFPLFEDTLQARPNLAFGVISYDNDGDVRSHERKGEAFCFFGHLLAEDQSFSDN